MSILVKHPGLFTTVQDQGRHGYQKFGVVVGGAMDLFAFRMSNLLVGNDQGEAGLEVTLRGPELEFLADTVIAICGGDLSPMLDSKHVPMWRPIYIRKGCVLHFGAIQTGCRAYIAIAGGIDVNHVLGSVSTYTRANLGGFKGRALQKGDILPLKEPFYTIEKYRQQFNLIKDSSVSISKFSLNHKVLPPYRNNPCVRFVRGRQYDDFSSEAKRRLVTSSYRVSSKSDRMGYRLEGPALMLQEPKEMISETILFGTIQVPPDGQPIILMADRQTTGGYPKIAQVIFVDLPILAQVKPGETLTLQEVSLQVAEQLYLKQEATLQFMQKRLRLYWETGVLINQK
ncbi:biotin-dependent carboxyltransferase family protein [Thermoflavimicrobium daqui]|uniref:KipI antagonist n=1 Tax=Thermoflavimicrobium daqui TaxID=2137476 RepID=A0A364K8Y6_9BACL|nr:biotin-dependent carboxyltransferase family protein [Thermoflavimicrobium daqui]RAL26759.1 KipI antagonist [Thermoflavimicrobium daqui]